MASHITPARRLRPREQWAEDTLTSLRKANTDRARAILTRTAALRAEGWTLLDALRQAEVEVNTAQVRALVARESLAESDRDALRIVARDEPEALRVDPDDPAF